MNYFYLLLLAICNANTLAALGSLNDPPTDSAKVVISFGLLYFNITSPGVLGAWMPVVKELAAALESTATSEDPE